MKSWEARAAQRGGMTQGEFLAAMKREGFVVIEASLREVSQKFTHPERPGQSFDQGPIESYRRAYERLLLELAL